MSVIESVTGHVPQDEQFAKRFDDIGASSFRVTRMSSQLFGGEQQRIAIVRGPVNDRRSFLPGEPTTPPDSVHVLTVIRILNNMVIKFHATMIVVTHDEKIPPTYKRITSETA